MSTPGYGGVAEALFKMCVGNGIGVELVDPDQGGLGAEWLFEPSYGSFIVELADGAEMPAEVMIELPGSEEIEGADSGESGETAEAVEFAAVTVTPLATTVEAYVMDCAETGESIDLAELQEVWEARMEPVFPYRHAGERDADAEAASGSLREVAAETWRAADHAEAAPVRYHGPQLARPRVVIPVFPGTNCEYDTAAAFEAAGAEVSTLVINNLTPQAVAQSTEELARLIGQSQIVMIPGGFSGGDEPDGSAKFITAFFRAPRITEAVRDLLQARDGLMLGICNGFQALVKLGLVPYGDIRPMDAECPTLTFNTIGRHQSRLVRTARGQRPVARGCPSARWARCTPLPSATARGASWRSDEVLAGMRAAGQIATQYVDEAGVPGMGLAREPQRLGACH